MCKLTAPKPVPFDCIQVAESCKKEPDGWVHCVAKFVTFPADIVRVWLDLCHLINMQSCVTDVLPRVCVSGVLIRLPYSVLLRICVLDINQDVGRVSLDLPVRPTYTFTRSYGMQ
jgi:hypothetical protein